MPFTPIKIKVPTPKRKAVGSTPAGNTKKPFSSSKTAFLFILFCYVIVFEKTNGGVDLITFRATF